MEACNDRNGVNCGLLVILGRVASSSEKVFYPGGGDVMFANHLERNTSSQPEDHTGHLDGLEDLTVQKHWVC